jgi:hypothetical protein
MSSKRSRTKLISWKERELRGLEKELRGANRWLSTLKAQLKANPADRWAMGMQKHYQDRVSVLTARIAELRVELVP